MEQKAELNQAIIHLLKGRLRKRMAYYAHLRANSLRSREYWIHKERNVLPNIKRALARIEVGSYGICVNCTNPIGVERLVAVPAALKCLNCQNEQEKQH